MNRELRDVDEGGARDRLRVRVRGLVQGVGFRPFVYGLAERHQLTGWVLNDEAGVLLEVQGADGPTRAFIESMSREAPPLSRIDTVEVELVPAAPTDKLFEIRASAREHSPSTSIGADAAPCSACLSELFDPSCRRYRYPFLNCTHCGPRYTITRHLPYDRPSTSMAPFPMCPECRAEYESPKDRRFHAEPTACPVCGPQLGMPVAEIVGRLLSGEIIAVKGVGGFQLACDAANPEAVSRLRRAKERNGKPFAVMFASAASARRFVRITPAELQLLESVRRPIVLARYRDEGPKLPEGIAPGLAWLGVMLPSSPLHYLLFHEAAGRPAGLDWLASSTGISLVMTSANPGGAPLITRDAEARRTLVGIADGIAGHDREIVVRCDDPVARVFDLGESSTAPIFLRRGRGSAPESIPLARRGPSVLAVGAFLKNAVCFTRNDRALLSQHIGDLDDAETFRFFEETVHHLRSMLEVEPVAVARDLHPDFLSSRFADALGPPVLRVQHHHAHVASVLAEHGLESGCGLALDGTGLGTDGTSWGGELLHVDGARFTRAGHLLPLPLPGGDRAAEQPWRMAVSVLSRLGRTDDIRRRWGDAGLAVEEVSRNEKLSPPTSACGRWFDAAAAILGVCERSGYEGEAPMALESLVRTPRVLEGGWRIAGDTLDLLPLADALTTVSKEDGADLFHGTLAAGLVDLTVRQTDGATAVVASGGCVANAVLVGELARQFARHGIRLLLPKTAPPGDGGLALGQAWVLLKTLERGEPCV